MADYNIPERVGERVRYYDEQFLIDQDFIDEQKYHINRQRLSNRLHVSGIIEGLEVDEKKLPGKLIIMPGTAIDQKGRTIVLTQEKTIDPMEGILAIAYKESTSTRGRQPNNEAEDTQGIDGEKRWQEEPEVKVVKKVKVENKEDNETKEMVVLGSITIGEDKKPKYSNKERQYSGVFLPTEDGKGVTLRSQDGENPNIAILDGSLTVAGDLVVKSPTQNNQILSVAENTENSETKEKKNTRQIKISLDSKTTSYIQIEGGDDVSIEINGIKISSQRKDRRKLTIESTEPPEIQNTGTTNNDTQKQQKEEETLSNLTIELHANLIIHGRYTYKKQIAYKNHIKDFYTPDHPATTEKKT